MSDAPTPVSPSISPWWSLLLFVPFGLLVGWLVVQLPTPKPREVTVAPPGAASQVAATRPMGAEKPRVTTAFPTAVTEARQSGPAPAEVQRPFEEAPSAVYSQWTTLDGAMAESQRNGKPLLIDFSADWCGPCRALKQQVFEDGMRSRAVQTAVIPVSIVDRVREEGSNPPDVENLQQRFQVNAFPTLVVFSPQSGRAVRTQGFGSAEQTVEWIIQAAKAVR